MSVKGKNDIAIVVVCVILLSCILYSLSKAYVPTEPTNKVTIKYVDKPVEIIPRPRLSPLENTQMTLKKILSFEEGFRNKPYLCAAGYVTIGYGTKLHKRLGMNPENFPLTITELAATEMLNDDIDEVLAAIARSKNAETFNRLSQVRKDILISMAYQIGVSGLMKFKKTWKYLQGGLYEEASIEMMDSEWAREDSPERAERHARVMLVDNMNIYRIYF